MRDKQTITLTVYETLALHAALQAQIDAAYDHPDQSNRARLQHILQLLQAADRVNLCGVPLTTPRHAPVDMAKVQL